MHDLARCTLAAGDTVLAGHVVAWADETLVFGTDGSLVRGVQPGDEVEVLVLDDARGEVRYTGWVARVSAARVHVADLELTSTLQKRQVARVRIAQLCTGVVEQPSGDDLPITFVVVDLGAHGMRISTAAPLVEHDLIRLEFATPDRAVQLEAEVLRAQQTASGSTQYGCRFVGLRERDEDTLFRFVLQTQSAQRRRLQAEGGTQHVRPRR